MRIARCILTSGRRELPLLLAQRQALAPDDHLGAIDLDLKLYAHQLRLGEVDAAIVYRSDVVGSGGAVHGIPIPAEHNVTLAYPLVRLTDSPEATAFASALSGVDARSVWATAGFGMP